MLRLVKQIAVGLALFSCETKAVIIGFHKPFFFK